MAATRALPAGFGELEVLAVGTVLLVEALSGLSLNGLTIFSFCKTPDLRTPSNLLILSLALADTGISLNALVAAVSSLLRRWPYGSEGCQAHGFQGFATALASICGSAAIAWGRYHHYCTRRQLAWDTAIPLMLFVWLSSAFWASLPLMGWGHYDYEPVGTCCTLDYSRGDRNFISFLFTMAFFNFLVPLCITLISYRLMEEKLSRSGHLQADFESSALLASGLVIIHRPKDLSKDRKLLEVTLSTTEVNTTLPGRMLLLGWGPYALLYLYAAIADVTFISPKLRMVPALIAKTMPTINAINYALHSEMVCRGIWPCLSPQKSKQDRTQ